MIPSWSDKHLNKCAQKIYLNAFCWCAAIGFVAFVPLYIAFALLLKRFGASSDGLIPLLIAPLGFVTLFVAQARAARALKIAGLYREETAIIERTATDFAGPKLEVRESSFVGRFGMAALFLVMGAGCYWLHRSQPFNLLDFWSGGAGTILCAIMALQTLRYARKPELRLDERGITSCQGWMSSRLVRWENVARLERKSVWGLPPRYDLDGEPNQTTSLQDDRGRTLLILSAGDVATTMGGALLSVWTDESRKSAVKSPTQIELFIAEIEHRLKAATPPVSEDLRDE